ncbi:MAG TPA: S4 domain-containing protein, partial [Candidatus Paceibacterota bacterium]|nr:S4 domain-containing protein [Candidatus Paceibacterota bacterium]
MNRLDQVLVERGLCDSREKAKRAVMAGTVRVNGHPARKPSDSVKPQDELTLDAP